MRTSAHAQTRGAPLPVAPGAVQTHTATVMHPRTKRHGHNTGFRHQEGRALNLTVALVKHLKAAQRHNAPAHFYREAATHHFAAAQNQLAAAQSCARIAHNEIALPHFHFALPHFHFTAAHFHFTLAHFHFALAHFHNAVATEQIAHPTSGLKAAKTPFLQWIHQL